MRELIERLEGLVEASSMDSQQFTEALKKKAKIGDRVLILSPHNRYNGSYDSVIGTFYNLPQSEASGARAMNNRFMFTVDGFSRELGVPPPTGKVKYSTNIRFYQAGPKGNVRGKTGTPEQIVDYVANHLERFSKIEPNRSV